MALLDLATTGGPGSALVLGDLIHSRLGLTAELRQKAGGLRRLLRAAPLILIGGNHERQLVWRA